MRTGSDVAGALSLLKNDDISHSVNLRELFTVEGRHQLPGSGLGGDEVLRQCHRGVTADVAEGEKRSRMLVWRRRCRRKRVEMRRCLVFLPHDHFMALLQTQALHSEHHALQRPRQRVGEGDLGRHLLADHSVSQRLPGGNPE